MDDRFKFRAWDKIDKMYYIIGFSQYGIQVYKNDNFPEELFLDRGRDCFELMQSTGLRDKNGKLIYEGDIVKGLTWKEPYAMRTSKEILGKVIWNTYDNRWFINSDLPNEFRTYLNFKNCEILGNIYENPELLK